MRLDEFLVKNLYCKDIRQACASVMKGEVFVNDKRQTKPGFFVKDSYNIELKQKKSHSWVSRGGTKLEHALKYFSLNVENLVTMDVGASTGGFSDVLLHNNVNKIYAIDVAYGEFAWKLRSNNKVILIERTNAKNLNDKHIPEKIDLIVCDASFISLKKILPIPLSFCKEKSALIALIKPQFEVAKDQVGRGGIVTNNVLHHQVCQDISDWINSLPNWKVIGITTSPIKGSEGNIEFLLYAVQDA